MSSLHGRSAPSLRFLISRYDGEAIAPGEPAVILEHAHEARLPDAQLNDLGLEDDVLNDIRPDSEGVGVLLADVCGRHEGTAFHVVDVASASVSKPPAEVGLGEALDLAEGPYLLTENVLHISTFLIAHPTSSSGGGRSSRQCDSTKRSDRATETDCGNAPRRLCHRPS